MCKERNTREETMTIRERRKSWGNKCSCSRIYVTWYISGPQIRADIKAARERKMVPGEARDE
jgi:hypothetical protein